MSLPISATDLMQHIKRPAFPGKVLSGLRSILEVGVLIAALLTLAGCAERSAVALGTEPKPTSSSRELTIDNQELAYIAIANATTQIDRPKWLATGWAWGSVIGAQDAVPPDCALHVRAGGDMQVYAACAGPRRLRIPRDGADFIYVTLIIGQDGQVRSSNVIAPK